MSNPTASRNSSISQHLRATKKILQDAVSDARIATTLDAAKLDVLERDAFEILRLIRSCKNRFAPVNKVPPEILGLVPDFLDPQGKDQDVIALTHVCRAWREVFVSWSPLWSGFDCTNGEKTRVYFERSKSSPINLSLKRNEGIPPCDPFFQVIPRATGRLRSLSVEGTPENIEVITSHLSRPAPLLECLSIHAGHKRMTYRHPTLTPALFSGDLSSLRILHLELVHTKLPWRNMVNLTSFTLAHTPPGTVSVGQLLDFFEGAPHLRKVKLCFVSPTTGGQDGRLVSMACLKSMCIDGSGPSSVLLDHLLIPVGAELKTRVVLFSSLIGEHLPRSLNNLRNFSDFNKIRLFLEEFCPRVEFSGPNGQVSTTLRSSRVDRTGLVFGSLAGLDTSKTERLEIDCGSPPSGDLLSQALLSMAGLRTLKLSKCENLHIFVQALRPDIDSSEDVVCPKLEEIILVLHAQGDTFNIKNVIEMAAARASRGKKLGTIRIIDGRDEADMDVSELKEYVRNVEYGPGAGF